MAVAVTQIATAGAALAWMFCEWIAHGKPSVLGIASGGSAGLVAIAPASGSVGPMGALVIGIASGIICVLASTKVKRAIGYDDSLDGFGIHAIGGIVGAILTGVFAVEAIGGTPGLLEGNGGQVLTQIWGILATIVWSAVASFVILIITNILVGVRVSQAVEVEGLDINLHGEVVRAGEKCNVPTPVNRVLTETLMALTNKQIPLEEFARKPEKLLEKVSRAGLRAASLQGSDPP